MISVRFCGFSSRGFSVYYDDEVSERMRVCFLIEGLPVWIQCDENDDHVFAHLSIGRAH